LSVITQQGGGTIIHPPGTLRITSQVTLPENLTWEGCGNDVSKIKVDAAVIGLRKAYADHSTVRAFHFWLRHVGLVGSAAALGGIKIDYADWLKLEGVRFEDFTAANGYGVELVNCYRWHVDHCHFENIKKYGLKLSKDGSGVGCNLGRLSRSELIGNNQTAFVAAYLAGQQIEVDGNDFEGSGNGLTAIDMDGVEGCHIHDNYIELWQNTDGSAVRGAANSRCTRVLVEKNVLNGAAPVIQADNVNINNLWTIRHNRFPDIGAGVTLANIGNCTKFVEYDNDPDTSNMTSAYTNSDSDVTERLSTFTGTLTGCTTSPTGTITTKRHGRLVSLDIPNINATSNSTGCTVTGMPAALFPATAQVCIARYRDNGADKVGLAQIGTGGVITLFDQAGNSAIFTATGNKGIGACTIVYQI